MGRTYRTLAKGPATNQDIRVDLSFNARGGLASETAPYYTGGTVYTTTFNYDALDRRIERKHPDNATIQGSYALGSGIAIEKVTITDELGRTTATHTGTLLAVDTFFVGVLRRGGNSLPSGLTRLDPTVYLQTAIDCYARYA